MGDLLDGHFEGEEAMCGSVVSARGERTSQQQEEKQPELQPVAVLQETLHEQGELCRRTTGLFGGEGGLVSNLQKIMLPLSCLIVLLLYFYMGIGITRQRPQSLASTNTRTPTAILIPVTRTTARGARRETTALSSRRTGATTTWRSTRSSILISDTTTAISPTGEDETQEENQQRARVEQLLPEDGAMMTTFLATRAGASKTTSAMSRTLVVSENELTTRLLPSSTGAKNTRATTSANTTSKVDKKKTSTITAVAAQPSADCTPEKFCFRMLENGLSKPVYLVARKEVLFDKAAFSITPTGFVIRKLRKSKFNMPFELHETGFFLLQIPPGAPTPDEEQFWDDPAGPDVVPKAKITKWQLPPGSTLQFTIDRGTKHADHDCIIAPQFDGGPADTPGPTKDYFCDFRVDQIGLEHKPCWTFELINEGPIGYLSNANMSGSARV